MFQKRLISLSHKAENVSIGIRPELIDYLMELYVEWREECLGLRLAYERWLRAPVAERDLAFVANRAALDREEQGSAVYADRIGRIIGERVAPRPWRRWLNRPPGRRPSEARSAGE